MKESSPIKLFDFERKDYIVLALIFLIALWLFIPGFGANRIMLPMPDDIFLDPERAYDIPYGLVPTSDTNVMYQPWNDYACERLNAGQFPLWDPYNLGGTPFFANSLNQLTYLPRLVFSVILPAENIITALAFIHFLLIGIGFYYLLKAIGISVFPAGAATFILLFKFSVPAIMMTPPVALTFAYTPLCLLLLLKILRGGRMLFTLYLAICLSCVVSSGYPVYTAHLLYLGLAIAIFEWLRLRKTEGISPGTGLWRAVLAVVLSVLFSLIQLVPLAINFMLAARPHLFQQTFANFHCYPKSAVYILYQNLPFPHMQEGGITAAASGTANLYLGIIPILFLIPIFGQWRNPNYRFYILTAAVFGLICFITPVAQFTMRYIPGFGLTPIEPFPAFFLLLIIAFAISFDHILWKEIPRSLQVKLIFIVAALTLLAVPPVIAHFSKTVPSLVQNYYVFIITTIFVVTWILTVRLKGHRKLLNGIFIALLALNYLPVMKQWTTFYGPEESAMLKGRQIRIAEDVDTSLVTRRNFNASRSSLLAPNTNIYLRMRSAQGYNALVPKYYADEWSKYFPGGVTKNQRLVVFKEDHPDPPESFFIDAGIGRIIVDPANTGRGSWDNWSGIRLFTILLPHKQWTAENGYSEVGRKNPEEMILRLQQGTYGDMTFAETYHPAWRYGFDDKPATYPVRLSEAGFILIPNVPISTDEVRIFYDPYYEKLGLILASASFIITLIALWGKDRDERKRIAKGVALE